MLSARNEPRRLPLDRSAPARGDRARARDALSIERERYLTAVPGRHEPPCHPAPTNASSGRMRPRRGRSCRPPYPSLWEGPAALGATVNPPDESEPVGGPSVKCFPRRGLEFREAWGRWRCLLHRELLPRSLPHREHFPHPGGPGSRQTRPRASRARCARPVLPPGVRSLPAPGRASIDVGLRACGP